MKKKKDTIDVGTSMNEKDKISRNTYNPIYPKTFPGLVFQLIINFVKNFPKNLLMQLIKMLVVFLIVLFFHTYLIVIVNEGFKIKSNHPVQSILAVEDNLIGAPVFWTFVFMIVFSVFSRIRKDGFFRFFRDVFELPIWLVSSIKSANKYVFAFSE